MIALPASSFFTRVSLRHAAIAALLAVATPATLAAAPSPAYGREDCRIAPVEPAPLNDEVAWSGRCEAGFASGPGTLVWKNAEKKRYSLSATLLRGEVQGEGELTTDDFVYTGPFQRGLPHGSGFLRYKDGEMYEGDLVAGKREGKGIFLYKDRSQYSGEFRDNKLNGWGEKTFTLGGSYNGQWRDSKFHGRGILVYAGSGRKYEGQFESGRIAEIPAPIIDRGQYPVTLDEGRLGVRRPAATGFVPLDADWGKLTEAQKNTVRSFYPALESGDEPPYPLKGTREVYKAVATINKTVGLVEGDLRIYVLVGTDGIAKSAKVYEKPSTSTGESVDEVVNLIASVMMFDRYKPAMCHGTPCEMFYPIIYRFSISN